jgi:hypothetical protein
MRVVCVCVAMCDDPISNEKGECESNIRIVNGAKLMITPKNDKQ